MALGILASLLSSVIGIAGPLTIPLLDRMGLSRDQTIATNAAINSLLHTLKVVSFCILGFPYLSYSWLLFGFIATSVAGSWCGTKIKNKLPERSFRPMMKGIISLLCLVQVVKVFAR